MLPQVLHTDIKEILNMDLEQRSINVGKALIMDTVRNANSGHTGGPLSSFDFFMTRLQFFSGMWAAQNLQPF